MSLLLKQPDEILRHIVSFAPFPDALNLPLTCKKLRDTCNTDETFTKKRKIITEDTDSWNCGMATSARENHLDLVEFFISKGADDWDWGMAGTARGGHFDLVEFFISKGADYWNWGMGSAAEGGHLDLVEFFIAKGANDWERGMGSSAEGGHLDLVEFFIAKGANSWDCGMEWAARGGHLDLVEFFIASIFMGNEGRTHHTCFLFPKQAQQRKPIKNPAKFHALFTPLY